MFVKFLFGVAMVAFSSFCGYFFARKYRQRKAFFQQLKEFNERYLSEISYYRRPIKAFAASYAYKGEFAQLLNAFFCFLDNGQARAFEFDFTSEFPFLRQDERQVVVDYFFMLGRGDSGSQKGYFSAIKDRLSALSVEAVNDCKKYGDLYVKLGFLCGLFILILII
jgi:stage III sporulation protein AB